MSKTNSDLVNEKISTIGFTPLQWVGILNAMQAARKDEREKIREIINKQLDLAEYSYDQVTIELLSDILNEIK